MNCLQAGKIFHEMLGCRSGSFPWVTAKKQTVMAGLLEPHARIYVPNGFEIPFIHSFTPTHSLVKEGAWLYEARILKHIHDEVIIREIFVRDML
jgi:hypothetical protein